jgi:8-oxo-dGTP diphosphatase
MPGVPACREQLRLPPSFVLYILILFVSQAIEGYNSCKLSRAEAVQHDFGQEVRRSIRMSGREYPDAPQVAVGAIVVRDDRALLVRRAKPPSEGLWAVPGGRVELGETLQEAVEREIKEETGLTIRAGNPVYSFDVILRDDAGRVRFHYVIVDLLADYVSGTLRPGDDACEARWVTPTELARLMVNQTTLEALKQIVGFGW